GGQSGPGLAGDRGEVAGEVDVGAVGGDGDGAHRVGGGIVAGVGIPVGVDGPGGGADPGDVVARLGLAAAPGTELGELTADVEPRARQRQRVDGERLRRLVLGPDDGRLKVRVE